MGHLFAHTVARKAHRDGILDIGKGFQLFRSREVAAGVKLRALSIGVVFTALMMMIEAPIEAIVGFLIPFVGPALDLALDGAEIFLLPLLVGATVLPHLVRKTTKALARID